MNLVNLAYVLQPEDQQSFLIDLLKGLRNQEVEVEEAFQVINIIYKKKARRLERKVSFRVRASQRRIL